MDKQLLKEKLSRGISSHVLFSKARFLSIESRESPQITDPRNFPFYYFLGTQSTARNVIQIGAKLGLPALCFLQGTKTPEKWVVLDETVDVYSRTTMSNVRCYLNGEAEYTNLRSKIYSAKWDLGLVIGEFKSLREYLDDLWGQLVSEGLLVVDYISSECVGKVFHEFCRTKNREPIFFETRNGIGILER